MDYIMWLIFIFLFFGFYTFCSLHDHLLSTLLSLEFMVLGVFMLFLFVLGPSGFFYSLMYLIFTACEGALGLSILIVMGRSHGGDYFKTAGLILF